MLINHEKNYNFQTYNQFGVSPKNVPHFWDQNPSHQSPYSMHLFNTLFYLFIYLFIYLFSLYQLSQYFFFFFFFFLGGGGGRGHVLGLPTDEVFQNRFSD